jgi:hypothetical protein
MRLPWVITALTHETAGKAMLPLDVIESLVCEKNRTRKEIE